MEVQEPKASWGGGWTEKKLRAFEKYVKAYLTIMAKNPYWKTIYFDAFAGSGHRGRKSALYNQLSFMAEDERIYQGAAERVVTLEKPFDFYYFIEKDAKASEALKTKLTTIAPNRTARFVFRASDCNQELLKLARAMRSKKYAALVFIDPFGMQVNWSSIAVLQETRSDIWILVPTGVIINRLLDKKAILKYSTKLEEFFGISREEIRNYFYKKEKQLGLFGEETIKVEKVMKPIQKIAELYITNLKKIWKYVTPQPLLLKNSKGVIIYHLVFASNNKSAYKIASQIIANT